MTAFTVSDTLLQGWKVLIVDDETDSAEVVQVLLEMCGAEILIANNGQQGFEYALKHRPQFIVSDFDLAADEAFNANEALRLLSQNRYAAAIIDLGLPGMDGWQLLKMIRSQPATRDLPCVAVTAWHGSVTRLDALAAGFDAYFSK